MIGFSNAYRDGERVIRKRLCDIAQQFRNWVKNRAEKWSSPILEAPAGRRDDFEDSYFKQTKTDQVAQQDQGLISLNQCLQAIRQSP